MVSIEEVGVKEMNNRARTSQQIKKTFLSRHNGHMVGMQGTRSSSLDKATTSGRQIAREKKLALLQDVDKLKKKLQDEENIHRALQRAFSRPLGSLPRLPPYLPSNTQELLAEIAVLEEEVVRLEEQVVTYKKNLYNEATYICSKRKLENPVDYYEQILGTVSKDVQSDRPKSPVSIVRTASSSSEVVSDRSSLSVDNKTEQSSSDFMKEKPVLDELPSIVNSGGEYEKVIGNQTCSTSSSRQKSDVVSCSSMNEKQAMDEVNSTADSWENRKEKVSQTSNRNLDSVSHRMKPASNDLSSSVQSYKNRKEKDDYLLSISNKNVQLAERELLRIKAIVRKSSSFKRAPNSQKSVNSYTIESENKASGGDSEPNKISEDILKCLCSIFIRMSTNDKGTKIDTLPLSESSDPYGTCSEFKERDIGLYKDLCIVDANSIDLKRKKNARFLLYKLKLLLGKLGRVKLDGLSHQHKLAFWLNIYNSCLINAFLEHGIPDSPEKVVFLMREANIVVAGQTLNAITIEHFILRLPFYLKQRGRKARGEERKASEMFGLECAEPLITFALSCGSWSSPAVRIYQASEVESELERAKKEYLQAAVGISKDNKMIIPKLLEWCQLEFGLNLESLLEWVCLQLPDQLRKEALICIQEKDKRPISELIQAVPYDFSFRFLLLP